MSFIIYAVPTSGCHSSVVVAWRVLSFRHTVGLFEVLAECTTFSGLLAVVLIRIIEANEMHYFSNLF